ncbi:stabilin-2 isoform X2 [Leucoraja erinacea]|uniref:stabilin-2 isoform X1 n=1 Tax=Leucoraja erinaceus TaxID=7782 RepID=UPI0024571F14|nr:stabilin-2 isoform X1 [Leucoraja erinacea]XP_055506604.1 stabilin-2 isoform X2 [Leucoraja erinacea]
MKRQHIISLQMMLLAACVADTLLQKSNRCDKKVLFSSTTHCRSCVLNARIRCPQNTTQVTKGVGSRDCRYRIPLQKFFLSVPGCRHVCLKDIIEHHCCSGYWGADCMECPGGAAATCSNRGVCSDGMGGNGNCNCTVGFGGAACEKCANDNIFGADCVSECECVHGDCNGGINGDGTCTCFTGYMGAKCDQPIPACRALQCPPNTRCSEDAETGKLACKCLPGYHDQGNSKCEPINPCLNNACGLNSVCTFLAANTFTCHCEVGYHGDGQICQLINPCQTNFGNCPTNSTVCHYDGPGKAHCQCLDGYNSLEPGKGCSMADVCKTHNTCHKYATCTTVNPGEIECTCNKGYIGDGKVCYGNMMDRIKDLDTQPGGLWEGQVTTAMLLFETGYSRPLTSMGPFTLFLPTNRAFKDVDMKSLLSDKDRSRYLAKLHIIAGQLSIEDLNDIKEFFTLTGRSGATIRRENDNQLRLRINGVNNKARILAGNIVASNGLIHVIDKVMDGAQPTVMSNEKKTLYTIISENANCKRFMELLQKSNLDQILHGSRLLTVFIPNNKAWDNVDKSTMAYLLSAEGKQKLKELMRHHIIPNNELGISSLLVSYKILTLANQLVGLNVSRNGRILLGDQSAAVEEGDIYGKNGRIIILTGILIPPSIVPIIPHRCDETTHRITPGSCVSCSQLHSSTCQPGSTPMITFAQGCLYRTYIMGLELPTQGCSKNCYEVITMPRCCSGFYGPDCRICPGGFQNTCSGHGHCVDGLEGNGTCVCGSKFHGSRCHLCSDPRKYGPDCDQTCPCVHGQCDNKMTGVGACKLNSCKAGYAGKFCERQTTPCGSNIQFCHAYANCEYRNRGLSCVCKPNYEGDGSYCEEMNACAHPDRGGCSPNAECIKLGEGRFKCECLPGWSGDGEDCTEVNNCLLVDRGGCHTNANCIYLGPGQNDCECKKGHRGNGLECESVNPCLEENGGCHYLATCSYVSPGIRDCSCQQGYEGDGLICFGNAIVALNYIPEAAEFLKWVNNASQRRLLSDSANFTLLVPSQKAVTDMSNENCIFWLQAERLPHLVKYHVVKGVYSLADLLNLTSDSLPTIMPSVFLSLAKNSENAIIGGANLLNPNIALTNGIMHIIDKVLIPDQTISDASYGLLAKLNLMPGYSRFREFIVQQGLAAQIESANTYTVYAPNNEAIEKYLREKAFNALDEDVLKNHVILGQKLMESDMHNGMHRETMLGFSFQVGFFQRRGQLYVNDAPVNLTDVETDKGVIHGLTKVLEIQKNRCDTNESSLLVGNCLSCQQKVECPSGSSPAVGKRKNCINTVYVIGKRIAYLGCISSCVQTVITRSCCSGFYGKQCQACPGKSGNSCFGNGICQDGFNGTGICACKEGFTGTACETCVDGMYGTHCDQECKCGHGKCSEGLNGDGTCECEPGWRGVACDAETADSLCGDICHSSANCIETVGYAHCKCAAGFKGNGTFCEAVDACKTNNGGCSANANCKKTLPGQRQCLCQPGYTGDGLVCVGINPCLENNGGCHVNAECTQTGPNQAVCNCLLNYEGDGKTCKPMNPCKVDNGGCSPSAKCNHTGPNERSCSCYPRYVGDGITCKGTIYKEMFWNVASYRFFYFIKDNGITELASPGPFTVFVPRNEAFENDSRISEWKAKGQMSQIVRYHIVACNQLLLNRLIKMKVLTSLQGETIRLSNVNNVLMLNNEAKIITSDVINGNGVIHYIDKLLVPQNQFDAPKNSQVNLTTLAAENGYSVFVNLLQETNLLNMISDPAHKPVTVFLPRDSVMKSLPKSQRDFLYNVENRNALIEYLKFHILRDAKILAAYLPQINAVKTLQGSDIRVTCGQRRSKGELYLNRRRCKISQRQMEFTDGIAYGINCFLTPPNIGGRCDKFSFVDIMGACGSCINPPSCPSTTKPKGETVKCSFRNVFHEDVDGCQQPCTLVILKPTCCSNYYGKNCRACPGGPESPCYGHGVCDDQYAGSGKCTCNPGFKGTACEQCQPGHWGADCTKCECKENGRCDEGIWAEGTCFCNEGWTGARCETQLDVKPECSPACSADAICKENGTCECKLYYEGDGWTCTVADQCAQDNGGCSEFAKCSQSGVNVSCKCQRDFTGDGYMCDPIDICADGDNGGCHEHATCIVFRPNRRKCACKNNYVGDGTNCTIKEVLVNRCVQDDGKCHANAECTDLHFEDKKLGVFHLRSTKGQYKLNYTKAQELCRAEDAVLATYNQLSYAQQVGYHMCAAGWLNGQRVSYPTSYSNPKCGEGHVGIVDYGPRINASETWDAFCYRMKDVECACQKGYVGDGYSCNGNLLQVLTTIDKFSFFLTQILNYANTTSNGRRFVNILTDLTVKGTLFVPVNSGFYENTTLSGRDIEHHFSIHDTYVYHKLQNGTIIQSKIGQSLLVTETKNTSPPSPEFSQQVGKLVNQRPIVAWDMVASNGIIHAINRPLQAPPEPVKTPVVHTGVGLGAFLAFVLAITGLAVATYYYYSHKRGPFSFQYFKSEDEEGVSSFDDQAPTRFNNPMYNKFTSTADGDDPFPDEHRLSTDIGHEQ